MRKLIEMAVAAGRRMQNPQTGFVHRNYNFQEGETAVTIPLVENFLFALALFRTRTAENIAEAKTIVDRLLYFQNSSGGNFPVYLHEYPKCNDWYSGFSMFAPIYWILKEFNLVLGQDLKIKLEASAILLLNYAEKLLQEKELPALVSLKYGTAAKAFGILWNHPDWNVKGESLLKTLAADSDRTYWGSSANLGSILASLQMAYPSLSDSPWSEFWNYLGATWHSPSCSFAGPALKQSQQEFEPQATLYDLYLGSITNAFSKRSLESCPVHLEAALIHPFNDPLPLIESPIPFGAMVKTDPYAFSFVDHSFQFIWGSPERLHTLCCQGGNFQAASYKSEGNKVEFFFDLKDETPPEDKEQSREISFYLDIAEAHKLFIENIPATTFKMGEEIKIESSTLDISLKFQIQEGEGQFLGHLMKGNRPSQIGLKGKNRYNAYDWQIFLRTIRRSNRCKISAQLTIQTHV